MGIEKIEIRNNYSLLNQDWTPHQCLNIITSKNGGGKTAFVNEVKKYFPKAIFLNEKFIENFFISKYLIEYVKKFQKNTYETIIYKYISEFYDKLNLSEDFIQEFEKFSKRLNLLITIDKDAIKAGIIRFRNNLGNKIEFNQISNSEKTAFILWLATKCEADILILDNVDAVFYNSNIFYELLFEVSNAKQIISTSSQKVEILPEYQFIIENGKIEKYAKN
jgi:ABC-type uncharacterized transport system ATPase component